MSDPGSEAPRNPVGRILIHEGRSLALVDLGTSVSDTLRAAWRESGKPPHESGGIIESAWLLPAGPAGGSRPKLPYRKIRARFLRKSSRLRCARRAPSPAIWITAPHVEQGCRLPFARR